MHSTEHPLADLYRAHAGAVHGVAGQICGAGRAADVTQEVFLEIWRRPEVFDATRGTMRALLITMARRRAIDILRSDAARRARETRTSRLPPPPSSVDHDLLARERSGQVAAALDDLPVEERDAIVTAYFGGCTYRETAIVLDLPEGTVKSRLRAGLRRLQMPLRELTAPTI